MLCEVSMISVTGCLVADVEMYNERMLGHMGSDMSSNSVTSFIGLAVLPKVVELRWLMLAGIRTLALLCCVAFVPMTERHALRRYQPNLCSRYILPSGWKNYAFSVVFARLPDNPASFSVIDRILRGSLSAYRTARTKAIQPASISAIYQMCRECGQVGSAVFCHMKG